MGKRIIASRVLLADEIPKHFIELVETGMMELAEAKRCVEALGLGGGVTVNIPDENAWVEYKTLIRGDRYLAERYERYE